MIPYQQLRNLPRIDLAAAIPLPAPLALFLEPTNICNFRCPVCPESLSDYRQQAGYFQAMPEKIWRKVYSDLWARLKVLRFYDIGEPLLNHDLYRMIGEARRLDVADRLELTTNGSLLTPDTSAALVASGVDYVRVSVYGTTAEGYRAETGMHQLPALIIAGVNSLRRARENAKSVTPHIYAHLVSRKPDPAAFRLQYEGIADELGIEEHLHNWGGNDSRLVQLGQQPGAKLVCSKPFYELAVHANGDVSACCADWKGKLHVGNVERESLMDVWNGHRLRGIQAVHMIGERARLGACADCTLIHSQVDDLDRLAGR